MAVAELGMFVVGAGVLATQMELFMDGVGALPFFPKLGFPLVFL